MKRQTWSRSNDGKYQSRNPVVRFLMWRFFSEVESLLAGGVGGSLLDVGCGSGWALERLGSRLPTMTRGCDIDPETIDVCRMRFPSYQFRVASVYDLPYANDEVDVVLCLEVLEHLGDPRRALEELARVARRRLVLSVPYEPWFSIGTVARGRHLRRLGRHPEHIQAWTRRSFEALLKERWRAVRVQTVFPWLLADVVQ